MPEFSRRTRLARQLPFLLPVNIPATHENVNPGTVRPIIEADWPIPSTPWEEVGTGEPGPKYNGLTSANQEYIGLQGSDLSSMSGCSKGNKLPTMCPDSVDRYPV